MFDKCRRIYALFNARNIEFFRDKGDVAWNLLIPFIIILGFYFMSSDEKNEIYKVAIEEGYMHILEESPLSDLKYVNFFPVKETALAISKVERHQIDMFIDFADMKFWVNSNSPQSYFLEKLILYSDSNLKKEVLHGDKIRYVDWLIPGLLAMNIMFAAFWGIGFAIVRYRRNGFLKRLRITPLSSFDFLVSQLFSRLWLIFLANGIIFIGSLFLIGFEVKGSYFLLCLIFLLGSICLISLSLIVASRIESEELASGLLNIIALPMIFFSGVWFSLEGENEKITFISNILPLSHFVSALRDVMIEGFDFLGVIDHLLYLSLMTFFFLFLGVFLFKWK